jgi:hypothetical protein
MPSASPDKMVTPLKYRHYAVVHIDGPFPLDVLRYDRCHPFEEVDSRAIEASMQLGEPRTSRFIVILKFSEASREPWFTQFWQGQNRVRLYPISSHEIPTFRHEAESGKDAAEKWIQQHLRAVA